MLATGNRTGRWLNSHFLDFHLEQSVPFNAQKRSAYVAMYTKVPESEKERKRERAEEIASKSQWIVRYDVDCFACRFCRSERLKHGACCIFFRSSCWRDVEANYAPQLHLLLGTEKTSEQHRSLKMTQLQPDNSIQLNQRSILCCMCSGWWRMQGMRCSAVQYSIYIFLYNINTWITKCSMLLIFGVFFAIFTTIIMYWKILQIH